MAAPVLSYPECMRIAYCISTLEIGGAEKQALLLANQMRRRGHIVLLFVLFAAEGIELETQLPVVRLNQPRTVRGLLRAARLARAFLSAFQPDLLHSHTFPANMFARMLAMRGHVPFVVHTFHNVTEGGPLRTLAYRLTRRSMDASTAVSEAVRMRMLRRHIVTPTTIQTIPNAIDLDALRVEPTQRPTLRAELARGASFVWIAVGRISRAKDYPNLLRAFALVHEQQPSAALWIVGDVAADRHQRSNRELLGRIQSAPGVRCLGSRSDVPALLFAADGFVLASAWEGAPLALAEAMAMQLPVVATDVGGVREILADCGELVPQCDSPSLASAMLRVMRLTSASLERLASSRARIEEHFAIPAIIQQWESFYDHLLARSRMAS